MKICKESSNNGNEILQKQRKIQGSNQKRLLQKFRKKPEKNQQNDYERSMKILQ